MLGGFPVYNLNSSVITMAFLKHDGCQTDAHADESHMRWWWQWHWWLSHVAIWPPPHEQSEACTHSFAIWQWHVLNSQWPTIPAPQILSQSASLKHELWCWPSARDTGKTWTGKVVTKHAKYVEVYSITLGNRSMMQNLSFLLENNLKL